MPILHRFLLGFGLIIAIGAVQGLTTFLSVRSLNGSLAEATGIPLSQIDAAWRASDGFREADVFLNRSLNGVRDMDSAAVTAQFEHLTDIVEAQLARLLSADDTALGAAHGKREVIRAFEEWKRAGLTLIDNEPDLAIPAPHVMERRSPGGGREGASERRGAGWPHPDAFGPVRHRRSSRGSCRGLSLRLGADAAPAPPAGPHARHG